MSYSMEEYYAAVDSGRLDDAVAMLAGDVEFVMILPTGERRGHSRADMLDYLRNRPAVERVHRLMRIARHDDVEFGFGAVVENGATTTGYFVSAMHMDGAGLIDRYQVSFLADFAVLPGEGRV